MSYDVHPQTTPHRPVAKDPFGALPSGFGQQGGVATEDATNRRVYGLLANGHQWMGLPTLYAFADSGLSDDEIDHLAERMRKLTVNGVRANVLQSQVPGAQKGLSAGRQALESSAQYTSAAASPLAEGQRAAHRQQQTINQVKNKAHQADDGFKHLFDDPVLQKHPSAGLALQRYLSGVLGPIPVGEKDLKHTQQQLQIQGYGRDLEANGVNSPGWNSETAKWRNDLFNSQLHGEKTGSISFGHAMNALQALTPTSAWNALIGYVKALPDGARQLLGDVAGGGVSFVGDITDPKYYATGEAQHQEQGYQTTADVINVLGGATSQKEVQHSFETSGSLRFIEDATNLLLASSSLGALSRFGQAAGVEAAASTDPLVSAALSEKAAFSGPGVVAKSLSGLSGTGNPLIPRIAAGSLIGGGGTALAGGTPKEIALGAAAGGTLGALSTTNVFQNIPVLSRTGPFLGELADEGSIVGKGLYYKVREFVHSPYTWVANPDGTISPIKAAAGAALRQADTAFQSSILLGAEARGAAQVQDWVAGDQQTPLSKSIGQTHTLDTVNDAIKQRLGFTVFGQHIAPSIDDLMFTFNGTGARALSQSTSQILSKHAATISEMSTDALAQPGFAASIVHATGKPLNRLIKEAGGVENFNDFWSAKIAEHAVAFEAENRLKDLNHAAGSPAMGSLSDMSRVQQLRDFEHEIWHDPDQLKAAITNLRAQAGGEEFTARLHRDIAYGSMNPRGTHADAAALLDAQRTVRGQILPHVGSKIGVEVPISGREFPQTAVAGEAVPVAEQVPGQQVLTAASTKVEQSALYVAANQTAKRYERGVRDTEAEVARLEDRATDPTLTAAERRTAKLQLRSANEHHDATLQAWSDAVDEAAGHKAFRDSPRVKWNQYQQEVVDIKPGQYTSEEMVAQARRRLKSSEKMLRQHVERTPSADPEVAAHLDEADRAQSALEQAGKGGAARDQAYAAAKEAGYEDPLAWLEDSEFKAKMAYAPREGQRSAIAREFDDLQKQVAQDRRDLAAYEAGDFKNAPVDVVKGTRPKAPPADVVVPGHDPNQLPLGLTATVHERVLPNASMEKGAVGLAREDYYSEQQANRTINDFEQRLNDIEARENPKFEVGMSLEQHEAGLANRPTLEEKNALESEMFGFLHRELGVHGPDMPQHGAEMIPVMREQAKMLASDLHLHPDAPPDLVAAFAHLHDLGYKPVAGKDIGHAIVSVAPADAMEGKLTWMRRVAEHTGLNPTTVPDANITTHRWVNMVSRAQKSVDKGRYVLPPGVDPVGILAYLRKEGVIEEGRGNIATALQTFGARKLAKDLDQPIEDARKLMNVPVQLRDTSRKKIVDALSGPTAGRRFAEHYPGAIAEFNRNNPDAYEQGFLAADKAGQSLRGFEVAPMSRQGAELLYQDIVNGSVLPAYLVGASKLEDMFRASMGFVGKGLNNSFGYAMANLPNKLIQIRNELRFDLSPAFSFRRWFKTQAKLAVEGINPVWDPVKLMKRSGTYDADLAVIERVRPGYRTDLEYADDADRYARSQDVFGLFNPGMQEARAAGIWARQGLTDEEISQKITRTFEYGSGGVKGRAALERTTNFVFFPFSFEKTLYRNLGAYILDKPAQRLVTTRALAAYDQFNKTHEDGTNPLSTSFWEKHAPVLEEALRLNAFAHGLSLGEPGGINRPILNMFLPQSWAPNQDTKGILSRFIPALTDAQRILAEGQDQYNILHNEGHNLVQSAKAAFGGKADSYVSGGKWDSPGPQLSTGSSQAQLSDALDMYQSWKQDNKKFLDHNMHTTDQNNKYRFPMDPEWGRLAGQPITPDAIRDIVKAKYPQFSTEAAITIATTNAKSWKDFVLNSQGEKFSSGQDKAEVYTEFAKNAQALGRGLDTPGANQKYLAAWTEKMRAAAITMAEQDAGFYKLYSKNFAKILGPLESVER